jgi:hypothetical protein
MILLSSWEKICTLSRNTAATNLNLACVFSQIPGREVLAEAKGLAN